VGSNVEFEWSPEQVLREAERRLRELPELAEQPISCRLEGRTLTLYGRVPTYSLKQTVRTRVKSIRGVERVDDRLDVVPYPASNHDPSRANRNRP
jgi:osmotically-inducible protein OsmY